MRLPQTRDEKYGNRTLYDFKLINMITFTKLGTAVRTDRPRQILT